MITVHETALLLNGTDAWVRSLAARGIIGDRWSTIWNDARHIAPRRFTYRIVPGQLAEFMRVSEDELERRLAEIRKETV